MEVNKSENGPLSSPKISLIIPCYNLGEYLDEAVDSVLAQTFQDYEIIIVNDGSTDEATNHKLENYVKPKTVVYHTENQGLPATRNYGIERAGGKYICCLDADDILHPDFLMKTIERLDADTAESLGFVSSWVRVFGQQDFVWKTVEYNPALLAVHNLVHVSSLFRRSVWKEVGGYSVNLSGYQDWSFWLSIAARGYRWEVVPEELFLYRDRPGSMVKGSDKKRLQLKSGIIQNNLEFYKENVLDILMEYEKILHGDDALPEAKKKGLSRLFSIPSRVLRRILK